MGAFEQATKKVGALTGAVVTWEGAVGGRRARAVVADRSHYVGGNYVLTFEERGTRVAGVHTIGQGLKSDPTTDYYPGSWWPSLAQALRFLGYRESPKVKAGAAWSLFDAELFEAVVWTGAEPQWIEREVGKRAAKLVVEQKHHFELVGRTYTVLMVEAPTKVTISYTCDRGPVNAGEQDTMRALLVNVMMVRALPRYKRPALAAMDHQAARAAVLAAAESALKTGDDRLVRSVCYALWQANRALRESLSLVLSELGSMGTAQARAARVVLQELLK